MKKNRVMMLALVTGVPSVAFAKAGNAYDGLQFMLAIAGVLLVLAGILEGIDYLKKNGKVLFNRARSHVSKMIATLKDHLNMVGRATWDVRRGTWDVGRKT